MKKIIFFLISITLFSSFLFAETPKSDIPLKSIENSIRKTLSEIESELKFEYPQYTSNLLVKYKTQLFMVHSVDEIDRIPEKTYEAEGPSYDGFILSVIIEDNKTIHKLVIPQRINYTYWDTDFNHTVISNTDKHICWSLSFGTSTDKILLGKIKNIIVEIAK